MIYEIISIQDEPPKYSKNIYVLNTGNIHKLNEKKIFRWIKDYFWSKKIDENLKLEKLNYDSLKLLELIVLKKINLKI